MRVPRISISASSSANVSAAEEEAAERARLPAGLPSCSSSFAAAAELAAGDRQKARRHREKGKTFCTKSKFPSPRPSWAAKSDFGVQRSSGKVDTISVKIPPGIEDGKKIRVRGQGGPVGRGGTPGDIVLTIHVQLHPFYQRRGNNLLVRVPVTLGEAVGGAKIDVPTPQGTVSLHVPPGTSSGTKLRVKGHGVTPKNAPPGDLLAEVQIVLPKNLSAADRETLKEIDGRYAQEPRKELRW